MKISVGNSLEKTLGDGMARLIAKGLMRAGDVISQRLPEEGAFLRASLGQGNIPVFQKYPLDGAALGLHGAIYAARPDVGAILLARLTWTSALSPLGAAMPAVFDEQVRHLGVETARVAQGMGNARAFAALRNGANSYCLEDAALCFGMGLERLLLNIEILEKCAESFVLAKATGARVRRIPWLIKYVANGRLKKDQKDAAARHLRGERSIMKVGY